MVTIYVGYPNSKYHPITLISVSDDEAVEIKTQNPQLFASLFVYLSTKDQ